MAYTYFIEHGFSGGKLHSQKLRRLLKEQDLKPAQHLKQADIVITHSAGHLLLPNDLNARLLVMVAPALPQQNYRQTYKKANLSIWQTAWHNNYLLKRLLWSIYGAIYLLTQPKHSHQIAKAVTNQSEKIRHLSAQQIVIVANRYEPWPKSSLTKSLIETEPWAFISLPGSHEHIWEHPEHYATIINHYARLLAQADKR